jgi:hypothetical protein
LFFQDSEDDQKGDAKFGSRISSAAFLMIMEDGIRTFMDFLEDDKEKTCQILKAFFRRNRRGSVDPVLLQLMKKVNKKVSLNKHKNNPTFHSHVMVYEHIILKLIHECSACYICAEKDEA